MAEVKVKTNLRQHEGISVLSFTYWFLWETEQPLTRLLFPDGSPYLLPITLSLGAIFCLLAFISSASGGAKHAWPRKAKWILIYLAWMGVSLLWTYAHSFTFAAAVYISTVTSVAAAILLRREWNGLESALSGIIGGCGALVIMEIAALLQNPDVFAEEHMVHTGTSVNANLFGFRLALGAIACVVYALHGRKQYLYLAGVFTGALIATTSKSGIGLFFVIMLVYIFRTRATRKMKIALAGLILLGGIVGLPFALSYIEAYNARDMGVTLTGRIPLWQNIIDRIAVRPVIGYGFLSVVDISDTSWQPIHAHNDFLQQWVTLGIPGLILAIWLYVLVWRRLRRSKSIYARIGFLWLVFAVVRGLIDSDMVYFGFTLQLMVLFLYPLPRTVRIQSRAKVRTKQVRRLVSTVRPASEPA